MAHLGGEVGVAYLTCWGFPGKRSGFVEGVFVCASLVETVLLVQAVLVLGLLVQPILPVQATVKTIFLVQAVFTLGLFVQAVIVLSFDQDVDAVVDLTLDLRRRDRSINGLCIRQSA